jgi:multiple sugar transport system permease protein
MVVSAMRVTDFLTYILLGLALCLFLFPLYWIVDTSFKPQIEYFASPPTFVAQNPTINNYLYFFLSTTATSALGSTAVPAMINSSIIATASSLLTVSLAFLGGYALVRFEFKGRRDIAFWILSQRMFPPIIVAIPLFFMFKQLGMLDQHPTMILTYTAMNLPFAIWMIRGFVAGLPVEIEESASIDGCSRWGVLWKIVFPLALPGIATAFIFSFAFSWNEFLFALILTRSVAKTLPIELIGMVSINFYLFGQIAALATIAIIPTVIVTLIAQRYLVGGLTLGAVK